jgi:plasmid stabilization system protein ParE
MKRKIIWSLAAKEDFALILEYIEASFGTNSALKMLDKTEATLEKIENFPNSFPVSELRPDINKAVISKQTSLIYRITDTEIHLLHFWDNRQDPIRIHDL